MFWFDCLISEECFGAMNSEISNSNKPKLKLMLELKRKWNGCSQSINSQFSIQKSLKLRMELMILLPWRQSMRIQFYQPTKLHSAFLFLLNNGARWIFTSIWLNVVEWRQIKKDEISANWGNGMNKSMNGLKLIYEM